MTGLHILVGPARAVAATETVWSLLDRGHRVTVWTHPHHRIALGHDRRVTLASIPDPATDLAAATDELAQLASTADAVFPLDDFGLVLADRLRSAGTTVVGPTGSTLGLALDKALQAETAAAAGWCVPDGIAVDEVSQLPTEAPFPGAMVLRPARVVERLEDRLAKSDNVFCRGPHAWDDARRAFPPERPVLVQRIVPGDGIGVFGLAHDGTLCAASGHRRVRPTDPAGSGASAAAARRVEADELAQAESFVTRTGWEGILMIEQIVRPHDGTRWFVEVNARPWGSTALARRRGLEYPAMAVDAALGLKVDPPPHRLEDDGTVARHLGREAVHFLMVMRGPRVPTTTSWPTRRRTAVEMLRWSRSTHWYNKQPGVARLWATDAANTVLDRVAPRPGRR